MLRSKNAKNDIMSVWQLETSIDWLKSIQFSFHARAAFMKKVHSMHLFIHMHLFFAFLERKSLECPFSNTEIGESNFLVLSLLVTVVTRLLSRMGVSIDKYRQRIGCFVRVATLLSSFKVRRYKRNTFSQQSKDFGTALRVTIRQVH